MDNYYQQTSPPQPQVNLNPTPPSMPELPNPPAGGGWFKLVLIVLIVALLSSATTYLVVQSQNQTQQSQITPTPTPDLYREPTGSAATANWKTYTNSTFKYQLKYPNSYEVVPQTDRQKSQLGVDQSICITKKGLEVCKLIINVFLLNRYKLIDNSGGFIFYFDINKKQWLHDKANETSQFVPKRVNSSFEAYIYKTGDIKCAKEMILIPDSSYTSIVEINNTICRDDEGNLSEGSLDISLDQILSTFKFLDQTQTNVDESRVRELISNFYQAFEKQEGELLFGYMTPPITSQEKGEYSWLTGANLGSDAFYRTFLRVKLSNPSIKNVRRLDDKRFEINAVDEFQSYSQVSTQWSGPTVRNVKFTVIKTPSGWVIDKFTYTGTITWTYKGTEKYNGFPNLDSN